MMLFDGAFHIPSWALEGPEDERAARLVLHCQIEEGVKNEVSAAVMALAGWLVADPERAKREADRPGSPLSMGGVITRLLAGIILPSEPLAECIGQMTAGVVTFDQFAEPSPGDTLERIRVAPQLPADDPAEPMLGETASGRLWTARTSGKRLIVSGGFGIDMTMGLPAGAALYASLGAALAQAGVPLVRHA